MSLSETIGQRVKAKIADLLISSVQFLLTTAASLLLGWGGNLIIQNGAQSERTPAIDSSLLTPLISTLFFCTFVAAILSALVLRQIVTSRQVSIPFEEAHGLRRIFNWVALVAFLGIVVATMAISGTTYLSLVDASAVQSFTFAALIFGVAAVLFVVLFSLSCYWVLPSALCILAQPDWIRWLPRFLGSLDVPRERRIG